MRESIRVLHVEDDGDFASLTADCLEREGIAVQTATGVERAVDRLDAGGYDCVVSDFDLPEADGIALLERVRERDDRLPFILFTGKGSEEVASDALAAGATDYLQKERGTDQFTVLANRIENAVARHRAVKELAHQNDRHRSAEDIADLGTWEFDMRTEEIWMSEGAYQTLGLPEDYEPDLESAVEHYHPDDREAIVSAVEEALESGESMDIEARYVGGEGDQQWVRVRGDPKEEGGEIVRLRSTIQDITRRKEREAELERYETIVQAAGDPVYTLDEEGQVTFVNDALVEMTGHPESELVSSNAASYIDEEYVAHTSEIIKSLVEDDDRRRGTVAVEMTTADGERIPVEVHVALLPADCFRGTVGVIRDVSERERRAREHRRYEAIMEAAPVGVFFLDTDGVLVEGNERAAALAGLDRDEFFGAEFSKLADEGIVPESTREAYVAGIRELLGGESEYVTMETEVTPRSATETRLVEATVTLLEDGDDWEGSVGIVRDVTEQRTHERALERKTERLSELIDIVSHDLRNPLNVAQSRLELGRREGVDNEHVDVAAAAIVRVSTIIDDALTLARLGAGVDDPGTVALSPLARRAWPDGADGTLELVDDVSVAGDPGRLETALENLFVNAVEHGDDDVTVRLGATADGFYVADDGPGIAADERDRVFQPGYTTAKGGAGFGLAIVEHVAAAHGWTVSIADSEGGGARFEFSPAEGPV